MTELILLQLAALALLALAAGSAGYLATLGLRTRGGVEALAIRLATGLGVLGTLLLAFGLLGWLHRGPVLALALLLPAAAAACRASRRRRHGGGGPDAAAGFPRRPLPLVALFVPALLPTFVWSLYPPTAFDATTYHLPFARAFAAAHRMVVTPDLLFPILPQLAETLFAGMLIATGVDVTMHLVQLLALAATALLLYAAGSRFYRPRAGLLAAALWLAHPLAHYQGASGYVDLTLAMFCLLAVYAWEAWRGGAGGGWLLLAGAAAGFAAGTKHLGLLWLGLLVLGTLVAAPPRRRLAGAGALVLMAVLVGGPWYGRLYAATGNPFYPLLGPLFGGPATRLERQVGATGGEAPLPALAAAVARRAAQVVTRPGELASFAWKASFQPRAFDRQSPLAPWHLLLAPLAAAWALRDRRLLRWLLLVAGYAALWTTSDPRFQLPSAALLALAGAGGLEHLARRFGSVDRLLARPAALAVLVAFFVAPGPLYAVYKVVRFGAPPPATAAARGAFLVRQQPGYRGVQYLDRRHGRGYTLYTLFAPELVYHARGRVLGQWGGPYRFRRVLAVAEDAEALRDELAAMDVDFLLVTDPGTRRRLTLDPRFRPLFVRLTGDGHHDLYRVVRAPPGPPVG